jgi:FHA domain/DUF1707 SHOCT-like domain
MVRASDRSREQVAAGLSRAAVQGLLSLDTLTLRLQGAFTARDVDQLDVLVADLPLRNRPVSTLLRTAWRRLKRAPEIEPPAPVLRVPTDADVIVLGRHWACDVWFRERAISRRHVQLRRRADGWDVLDLASTNGTFLNGRRIYSGHAYAGDELQVADRRFVLPR